MTFRAKRPVGLAIARRTTAAATASPSYISKQVSKLRVIAPLRAITAQAKLTRYQNASSLPTELGEPKSSDSPKTSSSVTSPESAAWSWILSSRFKSPSAASSCSALTTVPVRSPTTARFCRLSSSQSISKLTTIIVIRASVLARL